WLPAFIACAFLLFWPVLHLTPFSDDHSALWNSGVRGIPWRNGFFRPLSDLSFRMGHLLWGTAVEGHRAFNVVLHGVNAFLLFVLMRQWADRRAGLIAALLFLLYPFHQESIVWLVGRESALGTFAILLGLVIAGSSLRPPIKVGLMALVMLLGALCYESALLLLPLAVLVAWSRLIPGWPGVRPLLIALGGTALGWLLLRNGSTAGAHSDYLFGLLPGDLPGLLSRIPKVAVRLFFPPGSDKTVQLIRAVALGVVLIAVALAIGRAKGMVAMRGRLVLLVLLTVFASGIAIAGGVSTVTSESDRFLHLPSAFLCSLAGVFLAQLRRPAIRWGAVALLASISFWQMRVGHANWKEASRITEQCMAALPSIPTEGRLWVGGLPDSFRGAFIFRNGFPEAVDLAGGAGDRIIVVPPGTQIQDAFANGFLFRGEWRSGGPLDRTFVWKE
ncbi:MAG: hypothetical protein KF797_14250, partial [Flavobacteriales bacterium]|nr:hypothetical protein [Flavobacteriales bacterium]